MPAKPPEKPRRTAAAIFRDAIEKSEANGFERSTMVLRLSRADEADLRRDRTLALEDIRFSAGVMHFLGVRVAASGTAESTLDTSGIEVVAPEPAAKPKKTRAKAKTAA